MRYLIIDKKSKEFSVVDLFSDTAEAPDQAKGKLVVCIDDKELIECPLQDFVEQYEVKLSRGKFKGLNKKKPKAQKEQELKNKMSAVDTNHMARTLRSVDLVVDILIQVVDKLVENDFTEDDLKQWKLFLEKTQGSLDIDLSKIDKNKQLLDAILDTKLSNIKLSV